MLKNTNFKTAINLEVYIANIILIHWSFKCTQISAVDDVLLGQQYVTLFMPSMSLRY